MPAILSGDSMQFIIDQEMQEDLFYDDSDRKIFATQDACIAKAKITSDNIKSLRKQLSVAKKKHFKNVDTLKALTNKTKQASRRVERRIQSYSQVMMETMQ